MGGGGRKKSRKGRGGSTVGRSTILVRSAGFFSCPGELVDLVLRNRNGSFAGSQRFAEIET
eukprot:767492-Hanusia_phi.AAC.1